jgi:hypothetical protein
MSVSSCPLQSGTVKSRPSHSRTAYFRVRQILLGTVGNVLVAGDGKKLGRPEVIRGRVLRMSDGGRKSGNNACVDNASDREGIQRTIKEC